MDEFDPNMLSLDAIKQVEIPDIEFEGGHLKSTTINVDIDDCSFLMQQLENVNYLTISNLAFQVKSDDFQAKHPTVGGAEGKFVLKMSQISIKIGVNFDISELLSSEYDMPESHIKF